MTTQLSETTNLNGTEIIQLHEFEVLRAASGNMFACVKLLVGGIFVMAKSCPEALSREIFWHTYSAKDV